MAQIFVSVTVRQDRQKRFQFENFKDSLGRPAVTDGGIQGIATESGAAEVVADTDADPSGLQVVVKSDLQATEFPSLSVVRSFIDTRVGEDVNPLEVVFSVTTIPAEAQTADVRDLGDEPRA